MKDGWVVGKGEDCALDDVIWPVGVDDYAGVVAEVVARAAEGAGAEFAQVADSVGDLGRGAVGVEGSVDEEVLGRFHWTVQKRTTEILAAPE